MKIAIMQPYFFPYIGYFQLIQAVDKFILYDSVTFIKKGYINRNMILNRSLSREWLITAPLKKKSSNSKIHEVRFVNSDAWKLKLLNDIYFNYKKAPYFEFTYSMITKIFEFQTDFISNFNNNSIKEICNYLQINTEVSDSEIYFDEIEQFLSMDDLNETNSNIIYPTKVRRIIEICKREEADSYYNSIGGKILYNKKDFNKQNIKLIFLDSIIKPYRQFKNEFVPRLSIIDVMMFNSVEEINKILDNYELS